jgi:CelD/BcsL family acetyltransferase involved in cellulose biosynthesis
MKDHFALWESLAREDASATFFQTPAWHRLAAAHFNQTRATEAAPLLFEFTRPGETTRHACLPLLRDRRWGRDRYFSPFGTYTALLCPNALSAGERAEVETRLAALNLHLTGSPFTRNRVTGGERLPARTQVIDLSPEHADQPARDWAPDPRRRLRIAREQGVTARVGDSPRDWDSYYDLYLKSLRRWGSAATAAYPRALFEAIRGLMIDGAGESAGGSVKLWLAEHEGKAAAGYIAFYHNRHACVWHGAADQDYFKLGAVQLLYHEMIADAARRGFAVFDLMGSAGLGALEAFKASLGARTVEYDSFLNRAGLTGKLVGKIAALRDRLRGGSHKTR